MAQTLPLLDFPPWNFQQLSVMEVSLSCRKIFNLIPTSSDLAKGKYRIYVRRAPRWKVAGQHCDCKQKERHGQKHKQIVRVNAVEETCHHGCGRCRNDHAGDNSNASQDDTFS
jgi:hypothetical protein